MYVACMDGIGSPLFLFITGVVFIIILDRYSEHIAQAARTTALPVSFIHVHGAHTRAAHTHALDTLQLGPDGINGSWDLMLFIMAAGT